LAGVKAVVLHDTAETQLQDLSAQFYLTEADVGTNRAAACRDKLQELNTAVAVSSSSAQLTEQYISQFQVCRYGVKSSWKQRYTYPSSYFIARTMLACVGGSLYEHHDEGVNIY